MDTSTYVSPYDVTIVDRVLNEETNEEHVNIHLWCLDRESKPWLIRINDFPAFCYIELPSIIGGRHIQWDELQASKVANYIKRSMGDNAPYDWRFGFYQKLYYYQGDKKHPMLFVFFRTLDAINHCRNKLSKPVNIGGFGTMNLNVYETQVDIVRKLFTVRDLTFCTWFNVKGKEILPDTDQRITTIGTAEKPMREMIVSYKNIIQEKSKESESWFTFPRIIAFDIETYSDNHKAMPDDLNVKHVSNIISCIYYEVGKKESRKKYVFVLGDSAPVEGAEVICVKNEVELIESFSKLIIDLDPEIISGYNIFAYDYRYLDNRLKIKLKDWPAMGRLLDKPSVMSTMKWKSGAYGYNIINILQMEGRISIDMLPIVKRDYRLDKYSLDFVSNHFLGRTKHDVKPVDMFRAYEHQTYVYEQMRNLVLEETDEYMENHLLLEEVKKIKNDKADILLKRYELAKQEITRIAAYCAEDSNLVVDLFDKLNVWLGLNALSSVVGVPIIQLFTRGQQIRCLSQVYDKCYRKGVVMDRRIKDKVFYNGGFVFEPKPGLYDGVVCLDFASLYPSIMRAYNICFTTLVHPELNSGMTEEQCETIEVEQEEPASGVSKFSGDGEENDFFNDPNNEGLDLEGVKTITKTYRYKWVRKGVRYGILPEIQDHLVGSRNLIKKELAALEDEEETCEDPKRLAEIKLLLVLKDKYSNALKVSANSLYGFLGAQEGGVLSLIEAAMCITATGRRLIGQVNSYIETKYHGDVVYGDSVTGETPILIRVNNNKIHWIAIGDMDEFFESWCNALVYHGNKELITNDMLNVKIEVWSDKGFTEVKRIIRHKTRKEIFEIQTQSGLIRCTSDHSLLKPNGDEIRPRDVEVGAELMHHDLPQLKSNIKISNEETRQYARLFIEEGYLDPKMLMTDNINKFDFFDIISKSKQRVYTYDVESAKMYHMMSNLVYSCVPGHRTKQNHIVSIKSLGYINDYVYDLETSNHHFSAGVGRMVVHNTDSSMVDLHISDFKEAYAMGLKLADEISGTPEKILPDGTIIPAKIGLFPPPLKIEFEKCLRILCIKKKKYAGLFIGRDGEFVREKNKDGTPGDLKILKRGIIVARRDTAKIVHKTYNKLLKMILTKEPMHTSYDLIMKTLEDLVNDRLPVRENLGVIRSLSDKYKSDSYFMKVFGDELTRIGKPPNPSDRLEYVIVKTKAEEEGEKDVKLGLKMRLTEMYEDSWGISKSEDLSEKNHVDDALLLGDDDPSRNKEDTTTVYPPEKIDYEYYIEHIMMSPIDQLFSIGYMKELEKFVNIIYTPQFCRMRPVSIIEPIRMVVRFLEDYRKKGYTIDQTKELITQARQSYTKILADEEPSEPKS